MREHTAMFLFVGLMAIAAMTIVVCGAINIIRNFI